MDAYGRGATTDENPRCWRCGKMLGLSLTRPWLIRCFRCHARNANGAPDTLPEPTAGADSHQPR